MPDAPDRSENAAPKRQRVTLGYALEVTWPAQFLSLIDALFGIFTLGFYVPGLALKYMFWRLNAMSRRRAGRAS
jgi:hypothetical protein